MNKPTRLSDEIRAAITGPGGPVCGVKLLEQTFSDDDFTDLVDAFNDPMISTTAIWRALHQRGSKISQGALQRHRRKDCRCVA